MTEPDNEQENTLLPPLVTMGNPRLAQPSVAVDLHIVGSAEFQEKLRVLREALVAYLGIGIAAPQIGWFERVFLMLERRENNEGEVEEELLTWINPEITASDGELDWAWEGCLSVPGWRGWISRPAAVAVRGYNERGEPLSREFTGWSARLFQHEFDHLDGMLFPYRAADPRHLVTLAELEDRANWPPDWPAPGARDAPLGEVVPDEPGE